MEHKHIIPEVHADHGHRGFSMSMMPIHEYAIFVFKVPETDPENGERHLTLIRCQCIITQCIFNHDERHGTTM